MLRGGVVNNADAIGMTFSGMSVISMRRLSLAHWPISPSPIGNVFG